MAFVSQIEGDLETITNTYTNVYLNEQHFQLINVI